MAECFGLSVFCNYPHEKFRAYRFGFKPVHSVFFSDKINTKKYPNLDTWRCKSDAVLKNCQSTPSDAENGDIFEIFQAESLVNSVKDIFKQ